MDAKKIGQIPNAGGWRTHSRQMGSTTTRKKVRIDYNYTHSMVDDTSRLAYSEILPDKKGTTCTDFLARTADYFTSHGIDRIERVMTDNHFSYRHTLAVTDVIAALGARHVFIHPRYPRQNGKVERYNHTLQTECAYQQAFESNAERSTALAP